MLKVTKVLNFEHFAKYFSSSHCILFHIFGIGNPNSEFAKNSICFTLFRRYKIPKNIYKYFCFTYKRVHKPHASATALLELVLLLLRLSKHLPIVLPQQPISTHNNNQRLYISACSTAHVVNRFWYKPRPNVPWQKKKKNYNAY